MSTHTETLDPSLLPDTVVDAAGTFGIKTKMKVPAFKKANEHVPEIDTAYRFDRDTTLAILAGFAHNRRVMVQGYHGTGKSPLGYLVARLYDVERGRVTIDGVDIRDATFQSLAATVGVVSQETYL